MSPLFLAEQSNATSQQRSLTRPIVLHNPTPNTAKPVSRQALPLALPPQPVEVISQPNVDADSIHWTSHVVRKGDSLYKILVNQGYSPLVVKNIMASGKSAQPLADLRPGRTLRTGNVDEELRQVEYPLDELRTLVVTLNGEYPQSSILEKQTETRVRFSSAVISDSLFMAATGSGMSDNLTMQLAHIFGWDIDFNLDIRPGDSFRVLYSEIFSDGQKISDGVILAAEFDVRNQSFTAVRFTDQDGNSEYYTPEGKNMRKAFTRNPLPFIRVTSRFNPNRRHPILKTSRPHRGVDYGAPTGTPVLATGNGKIVFRGNKGGYGKTLIIKHGEKYSTLYAHLNNFNRNALKGGWVKQGQTIGYVGQSGLATGPHLHYEFRVNGVHMDPLTVAFPNASPLPQNQRRSFQQQSEPLLAQLEKYKSFETAAIVP